MGGEDRGGVEGGGREERGREGVVPDCKNENLATLPSNEAEHVN
jgi:hypothetical protein